MRRAWGLRTATRVAMTALATSGLLAAAGCDPAGAAVGAAPGWEVTAHVTPTHLAPGRKGQLELDVYNVGAANSSGPVTVTDTLPPGLTATSAGYAFNGSTNQKVGKAWICSGTTVVTCTNNLDPFQMPTLVPGVLQRLIIKVNVGAVEPATETNRITVAGGGALQPVSRSQPVVLSSAPTGFGFAGFDGWFTNADGTSDTQAGSHPYELTVAFNLNAVEEGGESKEGEKVIDPAGGNVRTVDVNLPPGIIGNPTAVPQCTRQQFDGFSDVSQCPAATQIGVDTAGVGIGTGELAEFALPVYNMVPPAGVPAQFAFYLFGVKTFLDAGVRSGSDYGISEHVTNIVQSKHVVSNSITVWGVPAEASHDDQRRGSGSGCVVNPVGTGHGCSDPAPLKPFLTLPTGCMGAQTFTADASPWEFPNILGEASFVTHDNISTPTGFTDCDHLGFGPSISAVPDTGQADTPAGLTVEVKASQEGLTLEGTEGLGTSDIQDTTVTLPEGVVINPGQAAGLQACQSYQDAVGTEDAPSCPLASKVGTVQIETPLLPHDLEGNVYVLQANPPDLQLLVAASGEGVNVKLVGHVHLDGATGRLTSTFTGTPELPFTNFKLAFSGGAQAALATPTQCGTFSTVSDFTPWSSPFVQDAFPSSSFAIVSGSGGAPCPSTPLPFSPSMIAGSTTDQAGGYTNFSLLLQRADGQQRVSGLQFKTPEGLLGMISKVPLCQEPQASQGTCGLASQIGHTVVEAGPGPYPLVVPQPGQPPAPIYLTGPYKGAPYGLSIVVPLVVGPFTLETQVVRSRIEVDPHTARLTVTTDPLPTIIDGIPADLRTINAVVDRSGFMFNPTNCSPQAFTGTATSTEGATAPLESHFQMGSCQSLSFKPNFKISTSGKTSRRIGASLDAKVLYPNTPPGNNQASSQSNIQSVKVNLPKQLPSRLTTLQKACPVATFDANPAGCPKESIVGHATAVTPVLPVALTGPAYFVSHAGESFPQLIVVLQGYGVTVDLVGDTFISKAGITSSTFKQIPDVPITSFDLNLPQGPFSALAANGNLCKTKLVMPTAFNAQDGAVIHQNTPITVTGCAKAKKKAKKAGAHHANHKRKRKK